MLGCRPSVGGTSIFFAVLQETLLFLADTNKLLMPQPQKTLSEARVSTGVHSKLRSLVPFKSLAALAWSLPQNAVSDGRIYTASLLSGTISPNI